MVSVALDQLPGKVKFVPDTVGLAYLPTRAELVSVFTYYCDKGLNTESGGTIRALNCSNAYGEYGAYATGVSATETADDVQLRGSQIRFQNLQGNIASATVAEGDTLTGAVSGATATATYQINSGPATSIYGYGWGAGGL